jgi:acetyltransferase-like isoleucine patch superfamily enzyme
MSTAAASNLPAASAAVSSCHGSAGIVLGHDVGIDDDCLLRHNVTLGELRHTKPGDPTLGARVEVGAGEVILGPVKGDDAEIGANTVVTIDVPPSAGRTRPRPRNPDARRGRRGGGGFPPAGDPPG